MAPSSLPDAAVPAPGSGAPADSGERALVERARRSDAEAFEALIARHQDRAYAVALRIVRDPAEAAEAVQEALVRVWRALPGFRGDAAFGTWLHSVVARRALDRAEAWEARRRREVEPEAALELPAEAGPERDPLLVRRVEALLAKLTPPQRAVVTLHYLEDRPIEAIAAALGLNGNTVKTHLHRARAALRAAWGAEEESHDAL